MRSWPTVKFTKTDTLDDSDLQKLVIRMMELGILTPEQGMKTINTGSFPQSDELLSEQEKFVEQRKEGYYMPLVNSINFYTEEQATGDEPQQNDVQNPQAQQNTSVSSPSGGRPIGRSNASLFSKKNIIELTKELNEFEFKAFAEFSKKYGVEKIENDPSLVSRVAESIIVSKEKNEWDSTLAEILENFDNLSNLNTSCEVLDIAAKHQLDDLSAAILYHSTKMV